jgi:hypothetical protein
MEVGYDLGLPNLADQLGAYYVGNAATHRLITIGVSKACNARVFGTSLVVGSLMMLTRQPSLTAWPPSTHSLCLYMMFCTVIFACSHRRSIFPRPTL